MEVFYTFRSFREEANVRDQGQAAIPKSKIEILNTSNRSLPNSTVHHAQLSVKIGADHGAPEPQLPLFDESKFEQAG